MPNKMRPAQRLPDTSLLAKHFGPKLFVAVNEIMLAEIPDTGSYRPLF